jgi:hypothetical protein
MPYTGRLLRILLKSLEVYQSEIAPGKDHKKSPVMSGAFYCFSAYETYGYELG